MKRTAFAILHFSIPQAVKSSVLTLGLLSPAAGCRNCDLVEAELRTRVSDLRVLREELLRSECQNVALARELSTLRQSGPASLSPEQASQTYSLKQVVLGRGTGGYDSDDCPGDEALQVVLEPRDGDGHTVKAPGSLHVEALEISPEGLKIPLSAWDLSPDQVRHSWRSGLFSTGYFIVLPWKTWPSYQRVRIIARFALADGRLFETDKDVTVRLAPAAYRKPAAPSPVLESPSPLNASAVPPPVSQKIDLASAPSSPNWSSPWDTNPASIEH